MLLNVLKICVRGRNEDGSAVLYHAHGQAMVEVIGGIVQLLEHVVDIPLTNQADCFGFNLHKDQLHCTSCEEGVGSDMSLVESELWAIGVDDRSDGSSDFVAAYYVLLPFFKYFRKEGIIGGVFVAKVLQLAM